MSGVRLEAKVHRDRRRDLGAKYRQVLQPHRPQRRRDGERRRWPRPKPCLPTKTRARRGATDVGGGTTDIAIYHDGTVKHTAVVGRRQSRHQRYRRGCARRSPTTPSASSAGCVRASMVNDAERVDVPSVAGKGPSSVSRQILCEIIEPRLDEIFELVRKEVAKSGFEGARPRAIADHRRLHAPAGGGGKWRSAFRFARAAGGAGARARAHRISSATRPTPPAGLVLHGMNGGARRLLRARGQNSFQGQASDVGLAQRVLLIGDRFYNSFWRRKDYV